MREKRHEEMRTELEAHQASHAQRLEGRGMSPEEARRQARVDFGSQEKYTEEGRAAAGLAGLEHAAQDLRFGVRLLRKSPGFTLVAALLLALGIGANAAIFSMVDWVMLRPLPVPDASQLAYLVTTGKDGGHANGFSYPNFDDIRKQTGDVFSEVAGVQPFQMDGLTVNGATTTFWSNYVSGNFFRLAGIHPALGRFFGTDDGGESSAARELVLSYDFWQSHFGGRAEVVGTQVVVDGKGVTVVGVAPRGFDGLLAILRVDGYLPFASNAGGGFGGSEDFFHDRGSNSGLIIVARRRRGVALGRVESELALVGGRMGESYPKAAPWRSLRALALTSAPPGAGAQDNNPLPWVAGLFLGLAGMVLLLACVNIANLLLARAGLRRREMAVRAALGAGRGRLLRQMLMESLLLSLLGGMGGLVVALGATRALNSLPLGSAIPVVLGFTLSWRLLLFAGAIALATGMAVGIAPAWQASRVPPQAALRSGGWGTTLGRTRMRAALVTVEIAGSLMLLIVAGLLVRSLASAQQLKLGFVPNGVFNVTYDPHGAGLDTARGTVFAAELLARVRALPGVASASVAGSVPMGVLSYGSGVALSGHAPDRIHDPSVGYSAVTSGYFGTLGIPLLRGRDFSAGDAAEAPRVAVVNQQMAERLWPHANPLGQSFVMDDDAGHLIQVVGVVADSVTDSLTEPNYPFAYLAYAQHYLAPAVLQIRVAGGDGGKLAGAARAAIQSLNPAVPMFDVQTMTQALHSVNGLFIYELGAMLAGVMGVLGLLMAVIGVYGVVAYSASKRTHEIGVRMALGAERRQILGLIFRQGIWITVIGLGVGVALAALVAQGLSGVLFGVRPLDPLTFVAATLLLAAVALGASVLPARRAMRADPIAALRCE